MKINQFWKSNIQRPSKDQQFFQITEAEENTLEKTQLK